MIRANVGAQRNMILRVWLVPLDWRTAISCPTGNRDQSLTMSTLIAGGPASLPR